VGWKKSKRQVSNRCSNERHSKTIRKSCYHSHHSSFYSFIHSFIHLSYPPALLLIYILQTLKSKVSCFHFYIVDLPQFECAVYPQYWRQNLFCIFIYRTTSFPAATNYSYQTGRYHIVLSPKKWPILSNSIFQRLEWLSLSRNKSDKAPISQSFKEVKRSRSTLPSSNNAVIPCTLHCTTPISTTTLHRKPRILTR